VIAIGSPFGFEGSVTTGVVSATNRDIMESPFDDYIQTDAAINHGNSGGPLFNMAGEVIGMNSILFAPGTMSGSIGLGFSIPSNDLSFVLGRMKESGHTNAGMLPIRTQPVSWMLAKANGIPNLRGALVAGIEGDGDRMMNGQIKPGDVVVSFNGLAVWDPRDLARKAALAAIGSEAELEVLRGDQRLFVHVNIQPYPEEDPPDTSMAVPREIGLSLVVVENQGVTVADVDMAGTASDSGIQKGDVILQIQQEVVTDPSQALRLLQVQTALKREFASVLVLRDGKSTWIPVAVPE
jgi:serine protease Do